MLGQKANAILAGLMVLLLEPLARSSGEDGQTKQKIQVKRDRFGDPLPPGMIGRLGTVRFRHGLSTSRIVISPDGKVLASGGRFPGLRFWEAATGRPLHQPAFPTFGHGMAFSPDGKFLLAGGWMSLFDVASGKEVRRLPGHSGQDCLAFSPDGTMVAGDDAGDGIDLVNVASGQRIRQFLGHKGGLFSLAYSPTGKTLASGSRDKTVRLWDVASGKELHRFNEKGEVAAVAFSPDGKILAWAGDDPVIRLWRLDPATAPERLKSAAGPVFLIAFSPDGKLIANGGYDGTLCLWDVKSRKLQRRWPAHEYPLTSIAFFPDGKTVASTGGSDGAIRLWETATGKAIHPRVGHTSKVEALRFSADGKTLRSMGRDLRALEWDLASGKEQRVLLQRLPQFPTRAWPTAMAVSVNFNVLAIGGWYNSYGKSDRDIHLCDLTTGKFLRILKSPGELSRAVALSHDGKLLALGGSDGIHSWDVGSGAKLAHFKQAHKDVYLLAFSRSGKMLASAGSEGTVRIWDLATRKELHHWQHSVQSPLGGLAFSSDDRLLITPGSPIGVWDVATGRLFRHFTAADISTAMALSPLALSRSGRLLAGAEIDSILRPDGFSEYVSRVTVWEMISGQAIHRFESKDDWVSSVEFSPDGRVLASGMADSTIRLWDLTAGQHSRARITPQGLNRHWDDLRGAAPRASPAGWALAGTPSQTIPYLKSRLQPAQPADPKQLAQWLADLKSERFPVREKAAVELAQVWELAEKPLRKAISVPTALDFRARVERLLNRLAAPVTDPDRLRLVRAVELLENIGTAEARQLLETLGRGEPEALLTQEARASCQRLAARRR